VPVGNGRPSCVELTDLQSLSLLVSQEPAVGGAAAHGPGVPECQGAGVPVGNGRPSCVELTDLQSLSLLVSREPAVGGSGATGSVGTECRSDRVSE
jgi:hypothetical protein